MNKKIVIGVVIAVIVLGAATWWLVSSMPPAPSPASNSKTSEESQQSGNSTTSGGSEKTTVATITYTDAGFSPATLTVKSGDTIKISNQSSSSLQLSSDDHPAHTDDPELNMATIESGNEGTLTVSKTGTWGYHNHLKSSHEGKITVN